MLKGIRNIFQGTQKSAEQSEIDLNDESQTDQIQPQKKKKSISKDKVSVEKLSKKNQKLKQEFLEMLSQNMQNDDETMQIEDQDNQIQGFERNTQQVSKRAAPKPRNPFFTLGTVSAQRQVKDYFGAKRDNIVKLIQNSNFGAISRNVLSDDVRKSFMLQRSLVPVRTKDDQERADQLGSIQEYNAENFAGLCIRMLQHVDWQKMFSYFDSANMTTFDRRGILYVTNGYNGNKRIRGSKRYLNQVLENNNDLSEFQRRIFKKAIGGYIQFRNWCQTFKMHKDWDKAVKQYGASKERSKLPAVQFMRKVNSLRNDEDFLSKNISTMEGLKQYLTERNQKGLEKFATKYQNRFANSIQFMH